jgi:beta-lactamase class A
MKFSVLYVAFLFAACTAQTAIPTEFPTPPAPPPATPVPRVEYKRDAELEKQFAEIAKDAKGKVGVAAVTLETGDAAFLNEQGQYPMQSVYKLPISMAVMDQVRQGKLELDEKIGVTKDDMVRPGQASVIRDKNPNGGEYTIRELIRLALVESDGTASDVLMRVAGGADEIQAYLTQIGIRDIKVLNTEKEMGSDWQVQYQNTATPIAAIELLIRLERATALDEMEGRVDANMNAAELFLRTMSEAVTGPRRLKGLLPKTTVVAHKTGTSGSREGVTAATNDIGIIYLPNGKDFAIAVFVSDSPADEKTRDAVIARIAKAAWDRWGR